MVRRDYVVGVGRARGGLAEILGEVKDSEGNLCLHADLKGLPE